MSLRICWLVISMTSKPQFAREKVKLGDVCTLVLGQSPISSTCNACGQGLPFFQGNADFGRINPEATSWCTEPKKIAEPGDILLSVRAPIGAVNIALEKCCIGRGVAAIRPNSRIIQTGYLKHVLVSYRSHLETKGTGSTFKAIGKKVLSEFEIPICSLNGQSQIENQLNQILDCIENCKMEIEQLDQLVKSRFVEMFGDIDEWHSANMSEVCSIITDGTHQPPKFVSEGIPFLFASNIAGNVLTYETTKYVSEADYEILIKRTPIEVGDVLVSAVGSFGHPAVVRRSRPFCFQRHIAYLKPKRELIDSDYLHAVLLTDKAQRYMDKVAKGVAQRTVTLKSFKEMMIPLPPLELQQEFADFVAQVDKSGFAVRKQIKKLQLLYDSLAQEYFGD